MRLGRLYIVLSTVHYNTFCFQYRRRTLPIWMRQMPYDVKFPRASSCPLPYSSSRRRLRYGLFGYRPSLSLQLMQLRARRAF